MTTRRQAVTENYFIVSSAVSHPNAPSMTTGDALDMAAEGDELAPEDWRLKEHMHTLKFDIIEGHSEWRDKMQGTATIYHMHPVAPKPATGSSAV